ncbi:branched-chain amino acid ABC transporter permease [Catellatospora citrea]|uniref:ABC transporter permease subunit n=1 Tax=Catellatospora citrea TaxID=53366 RepID=UPI0033D5CED8
MTSRARLAAAALGCAAAAAAPWVLDAYTIAIATSAVVAILVAAGAQLLTRLHLPSLGQAAYLGTGAYAAATAAAYGVTDAAVQLAAAIAVAAGMAAAVGVAVARTRGTVFMLATLAIGELAHTAAARTGEGLSAPAATLAGRWVLDRDGETYLWAIGCALPLLAALAWLSRGRTGLIWQALADHEPRAAAAGHWAAAYIWAAYVTAAAAAGAAGALLVAAHRYVGPADMAFDVSALALLATIIGQRSLTATCAAAAAIVAARDLLGAHLPGHSPLLLGAVFLTAAYLTSRRHTPATSP